MLRTDLVAFLTSVLLSLVLTRWVRNFALARGQVDVPGPDRHLHPQPVPRLGGVAIWLAFSIVVGAALVIPKLIGPSALLPARTALGLLGPALIVFLMGLCDDLHGLGPYAKFGVQSLAALLLYLGGFGIHRMDLFSSGQTLRTAVGLPLTVLWVVLITNAFNLMDGLDGLAAGSALFSTLVVFVVSLLGGNHFVAFLAVVLAGAVAGFLRFNFNPATIFLGDSGSLFIGFMLSALALAGSQKAPTIVAVAIPVVSFGLPILDVGIAVVRRFLSGKPLFHGDFEHIHHKLLKRGLSQREAVLILYGVSALFGVLSLALLHGGEVIALVLVVLGVGVCVGVQQLRYQEFSELRSVVRRAVSQKQIIANDLQIRRATESLRACTDVSTLCRILTDALKPMDFDGFSFQLPASAWFPESFPTPLAREPRGKLGCSWTLPDSMEPTWELKLELISTSGDKCGFFFVRRQSTGRPLLLDINLLSDGFHAALADAVHRTIIEVHPHEQDASQMETSIKARAASVSSSD
jgi:UDP-GlcNAc:undecaprenyl-phosphate GlcNAc-1-phosphate transferase